MTSVHREKLLVMLTKELMVALRGSFMTKVQGKTIAIRIRTSILSGVQSISTIFAAPRLPTFLKICDLWHDVRENKLCERDV